MITCRKQTSDEKVKSIGHSAEGRGLQKAESKSELSIDPAGSVAVQREGKGESMGRDVSLADTRLVMTKK